MTERYIPKKRTSPIKAIREFCMECVGGQHSLIKDCVTTVCALHDFRMGKNPFRKVTEAQREKGRKLAAMTKDNDK